MKFMAARSTPHNLIGVLVAILVVGLTVTRASADSPTTHTVAWGETLYSIARTYGVTPQAIAKSNGIRDDEWVYAGARLKIPIGTVAPASMPATSSTGYYVVRAGDTLFSIASRFKTSIDTIAAANNLPPNGLIYVGWSLKIPSATKPQIAPSSTVHIVQPGEYLLSIALRYGTTPQAIVYANDLPNDWLIFAGQRLSIPGGRSPRAPSSAPTTLALRLSNVPLYRQKQTLTCEEASAAMATRGMISENQLLAAMPRSDNPFNGIRGRVNSPNFGGLTDYGVYAQGLQKGLNALGVKSQLLYMQAYDDFKNTIIDHLRAGRPVIWWHTWQDSYQKPVVVKLPDGASVKLVPYEHASVIVGVNDSGVIYHDPYDGTVSFVAWQDFRRVSAYFDNMALAIQ